jgi:hypothetical protein
MASVTRLTSGLRVLAVAKHGQARGRPDRGTVAADRLLLPFASMGHLRSAALERNAPVSLADFNAFSRA